MTKIVITDCIFNCMNQAYFAGYNIKYIDKNSRVHMPAAMLLDKQYKEINFITDKTDTELAHSLQNIFVYIQNGDYDNDKIPDKIKVYFKNWCLLFVKAL